MQEIAPPSLEASNHVCRRHVMAALPHAIGNALQRKLNGFNLQEHDLDAVACRLPTAYPRRAGQTAQRAFEGKVGPCGGVGSNGSSTD